MKGWMLRFWIGMAGYIVLLFGSTWLRPMLGQGLPAAIVTLLPMIPLVYAMATVFNGVRCQDELMRQIHLESILVTALATAAITFAWGLLEAAELAPPLPILWVGPGMIAVWGVTNYLVGRRYR